MFKNQPNKVIKSEEDSHWISRSCVAICLVTWNSKFLIVQRGDAVIQSGKWCLPCGYLDYDETIEECAVREIWEESGLDIRKYIDVNNISPVYINSDPGATKNQDVCFHFNMKIDSIIEPKTQIIDLNETLDIKWVTKDELVNYSFAFNHDKRIMKYEE